MLPISDLNIVQAFDIRFIVSASINTKRETDLPKSPLNELMLLNTEFLKVTHTLTIPNCLISETPNELF